MTGSREAAGTESGASLAMTIVHRRRRLGLRQRDLADLAGVSERFVQAVEAGKQTVQLDKLLTLLAALGLHLEVQRGAGTTVSVRSEVEASSVSDR